MVNDFSGKKLCGKLLKDQNLANSNFQGADIRGANFTNTILTNANFSYAISGSPNYVRICLFVISSMLIALSSIISILATANSIFPDEKGDYSIANAIALVSLLLFFFLTHLKGFLEGLASGIAALIPALAIGVITPAPSPPLILELDNAWAIGSQALVLTTISYTIIALAVLVNIIILESVPLAICVAICTAISSVATVQSISKFTAIFTAIIITIAAIYISWQALVGNEKFLWIYKNAVFFASIGGTSFRGSNLTNVNFTGAKLKSADFRRAILTHTNFRQVKMLNFVIPGKTYLQCPPLCQLLITGQGENQNFDRMDFRGVNLQAANLVDASFIGTNFSGAKLQDADLSRAKLQQTQLDKTDFSGAILTGAYIEDWNITSNTKFDGVRCQYVYMRVPTKENPDPLRKPDNNKEVFADGEFGDFIKLIVDTLDLYHNQGVDPRAMAISFKQLAQNHPEAELEIVAMEKRGKDKFLLRAKTTPQSDKSALSAKYFETYNQLKGLPEPQMRLLVQEQGSRIRNLENMLTTAIHSPKFYEVKTILILAANPKTTSSLRLDEEVREIDAGLQRAKKREEFDLKQRWAVRVRDVSQALLDYEPQIVHFCGHGSGQNGLALEDVTGNVQLVNTEALAKLFQLFANTIECVVLNACYSEVQASAIAKHIPYVIGMNKEIGDQASIEFAIGFYAALGAGKSIEFAYEFGCNAMQMSKLSEDLTPVLKKKSN